MISFHIMMSDFVILLFCISGAKALSFRQDSKFSEDNLGANLDEQFAGQPGKEALEAMKIIHQGVEKMQSGLAEMNKASQGGGANHSSGAAYTYMGCYNNG